MQILFSAAPVHYMEMSPAGRNDFRGGLKRNILLSMTELLDVAVAKLAALAPEEQDRIAQWLLRELPDEELWERQFSEIQDALAKLAAETRSDRANGKATELTPAEL